MNEILHRIMTRRSFIFVCLSMVGLTLSSSQVHSGPEQGDEGIPPPRHLRYEIDSKIIKELTRQNQVNLLIHAYGAIEQNGKWILHPISEETLQAAVLLFQHLLTNNPHCKITVLMGGEVPYDNLSIAELEGQRMRDLIAETTLPSQNITILDTQQSDNRTGEPLSRGFSTSGELDYAWHFFGVKYFYSFAPSPHMPRIELLMLNKGIIAGTLSFDGVVYILGVYEKIKPLIRKYWLKFMLYEAAMRLILKIIDPKGKYFEKRARLERSVSPPPTF